MQLPVYVTTLYTNLGYRMFKPITALCYKCFCTFQACIYILRLILTTITIINIIMTQRTMKTHRKTTYPFVPVVVVVAAVFLCRFLQEGKACGEGSATENWLIIVLILVLTVSTG
jgi:hypothetical protein